jgi:hypothetical protein
MAIRMEQGVFKMMVEMCYEMEACDVIQRALDGAEEDFNDFKRVSKESRVHFLSNLDYVQHGFKAVVSRVGMKPPHHITIKVPQKYVIDIPDYGNVYPYRMETLELALGRTPAHKKAGEIIVFTTDNHQNTSRGYVVKTFNEIKPFLYETLRDAYEAWYRVRRQHGKRAARSGGKDWVHGYLVRRIVPTTWEHAFQ